MSIDLTLAERLKKAHATMSPAERRVARALIADYPISGLEPVHRLAERANVSAPTVLRLLSKLGIGSYPDMQELLKGEIAARTSSPLEMYRQRTTGAETGETGDDAAQSDVAFVAESRRILTEGMDATFDTIPESELLDITKALANPKRRIWTVGGRFSNLLAEYLSMHLKLLRKDVHHLGAPEFTQTAALLDFGARDLLVAFDYRRYQQSTVELVRNAKDRKATTVLFTDPWLSPAAKYADHLLSSSVTAPSPFDSLTPSFALVETVIAGIVDELGESPQQRISAFDSLEAQIGRVPGPED